MKLEGYNRWIMIGFRVQVCSTTVALCQCVTRKELERDMSFSPHEVYSRYLVGAEGYPLWTPQLNAELPDDYQMEGLKIGDVGLVSPMDGSFDVLFNITLPRNKQPYPNLVREGFIPVTLDPANFATQHDAVSTHGVIPSASVKLTSKHVDTGRDQTPSRYATFHGPQLIQKSEIEGAVKGQLRI